MKDRINHFVLGFLLWLLLMIMFCYWLVKNSIKYNMRYENRLREKNKNIRRN